MCLEIKPNSKPIKARKDKIVWKHIINRGNGVYKTSYMFHVIEIGKTYYSEICKKENRIGTALHSYKSRKIAIGIINNRYPGEKLVKCIIPKNSIYYKGTFLNSVSYASNKLKYVEIVNI